MSEQPPRASSQVPFPPESAAREVHPDPEAPGAAGRRAGTRPTAGAPSIPREDTQERIRARTGVGLDYAADAVRTLGHRARDRGGVIGQAEPIAYRVGDSLQSAASYVREHDIADMRDDVELGVRRSPLKALAIAALGGFLLGRLIR